jgi:hypothetical protein
MAFFIHTSAANHLDSDKSNSAHICGQGKHSLVKSIRVQDWEITAWITSKILFLNAT